MPSDFWAKKLGSPAQPQPAVPPVQSSQQPWWAPTQVVTQPQQTNVQQNVTDAGESDIGTLLQQEHYTTTKARSNRSSDRCPNCGSGNYLNIAGMESRPKRCFECGYNPLFEHTMAGLSAHTDGIPVKTARGQAANKSDYNPRNIIGRV